MKRFLMFVLVLILFIGLATVFKHKLNKDLSQPVNAPEVKPLITVQQDKHSKPEMGIKTSLFIPYWTLSEDKIDSSGFDSFIYFGIKPDKQGISKTEQEDQQLKKFNDSLPSDSRKLLALRMTETQENLDILSKPLLQRKIIDQTIQTAKENNMRGIVLDLEISAIPFDSLIAQINKFLNTFYAAAKKDGLTYALTFYGDTFYRARPYDVKTLAQNADTIMIMVYDLHKAKGNPGPNFPLKGREKFGYDVMKMTDDFLEFIPPEKVSVIFGLFGYDWVVNEKGIGLEEAQALTLSQIKQKFIDKCEFANCSLSRDKDAGESQIRYIDKENRNHIIWFDDMESIKQKQEYLKQKGINSFSYWAYSYF